MQRQVSRSLPDPPSGAAGWPWIAARRGPLSGWRRRAELPRISVVVPSYEQGEYLEQALRSLLLQGYPDLELLVVDGGSQDSSVDVLRNYESYLDFWVSEADRGQTHAINKGFERATGEVLGWLNSDDILLPGSLERIGAAFARDAEMAAEPLVHP